MAFWTEDLDHAPLHDEFVAVLRGSASSDEYLAKLVSLALEQLDRILQDASPIRARTLVQDEHWDAPAASVSADGSLHISQRFLRDAAEVSLDHAFLLGRLLHLSYFGTEEGPAAYLSPQEFVTLALDCEESRLDEDRYDFELHERVTVGFSRQLRGAVPATQMPVLPAALIWPMIAHASAAEDNRDPHMYGGENGRYATRLYHHVLLNVLLYTFAHEAGHLLLGHAGEEVERPAQREREVDADKFSLEVLHATASQADLRPAVAIFRILHERRPTHLPDYSLTHPSSSERLQALAAVVESNPEYRRLVPEMDEALRSIRFQLPFGSEPGGASHTSASTYSDTEAAHIELLLDPDDEEDFKTRDDLSAWCRLLYCGVRGVDAPYSSASVLCTLRRQSVGSPDVEVYYEEDGSGGLLAKLRSGQKQYYCQILVPPAWRHTWPDGLLRVADVRGSDRIPERAEWSTDLDDDLAPMTSLLAAIDHGRVDVREVSGWVRWCFEQGREADALALNSRAVQMSPSSAGYQAAMGEIHRLVDLERFDAAESIARRFLAEVDRSRPGLFQACGVAAFHRGEFTGAFDCAFLEMHAFGYETEYSGPAAVLMQNALDALDEDARSSGDGTKLRAFFSDYQQQPDEGRFRGRQRRADQLRTFLAQFDALSIEVQGTVAVYQLRAEVLHDIGALIGDKHALDESARLFRAVITREPGFSAGWVQLGHALIDLGRETEAEECLARAEELGPSSPQVRELQMRVIRARRERRWRSRGARQKARKSTLARFWRR